MSRIKEQSVIDELKNGSTDILLYLTQQYFQSSRRWLRSKGVRDADTPQLFSKAVINLMRELQAKKPSAPVDMEKYIFTKINEALSAYKVKTTEGDERMQISGIQLTARCFAALDDDARKLLSAYYADNLTFEELAVRFEFSNPVIAEFEVNRQMKKLEGIVKVAMES